MTVIADDYLDSPLTTGKLAIGSSVNATLARPDDSDWFAVELLANTDYMFAISTAAPVQGSYQSDWLSVNNAAGQLLLYSDLATSTYNPVIDFRPTVAGTYYVAATVQADLGPAAIAYSVSAAVRTGADDFAAGAVGAGVLRPDGTATGVFEVAGDRDWFKFHADAGVHYGFYSITTSSGGVPAGFVPATSFNIVDASGARLSWSGAFDAIVSGDYYVEATGMAAGSYAFGSTAIADDYPAGNLGAGTLAAGGSVSGLMQYPGDHDRFTVTLEAHQYYSFTLSASRLNAQTLYMIGLDGEAVVGGYTYSSNAAPTFSFYASVAGDYHLDVSQSTFHGDTVVAVPYTISASTGRADDVGDTPATATMLAVGGVAHAAVQGRSDIDMFKTTLVTGVSYAFALTPDVASAQGLTLSFLGADGSVIEAVPAEQIGNATFTPTHSGDYIAAVGASGAVAASVPYVLALTQPLDDFGASAATAGRVAIGASVGGVLEAGGGDSDWFAVTLVAGTTYWFTLGGGATSAYALLRLLDANGVALAPAGAASAAPAAGTVPFVPVSDGTYYIEVSSPSHGSGAYTIAAAVGQRDDYGNTPAGAGQVTPTAPATGKFELATDTDMFRISVVAGVVYGLDPGASQFSGAINLIDSTGVAIRTMEYGGAQVLFTATATGNAYITLAANSPASYTLKETVYGVDDYGADAASAGVLAPGTTVRGAVNYPGDVDWFRVHLDSGVSYAFQLLGAAEGAGTIDASRANFAVVNSYGGTPAGALGTLSGAIDVRLGFTPATTADYYLNIGYASSSSATGAYTVKTFQLSGDTIGPALVSQSLAAGATGVSLTAKAFSFTFSEPITIDKNAITIKDAAGNSVALEVGATLVDNTTLSLRANANFAPGTYTLSIPHAAVHDLAGNAYSGPETISFSTALPVATGTSGNDLIVAAGGAAGLHIDGGAGIDTVFYPQSSSYYAIVHAGSTLTLTDKFTGRVDTLVNVERVVFDGPSSNYTRYTAYDVDGNGGQAYRLYQAAFHRTPDAGGVGYWIAQLDNGASLRDVAQQFVGSAEFTALYGAAPSDNAYITALYSNVLHRAPDAAGFAYWGGAMHNGGTRADVLQQFSESAENQIALVAVISNGFSYTLY